MKLIITLVFFLIGLHLCAQNVVKTKMSSCDKKSTAEYVRPYRLIQKEMVNDTLHLKVGIVKQCSYGPEVTLQQSSDSLFIEFNDLSEIYTWCYCCYELDIQATEVQDTNFKLIIALNAELFTNTGFEDSVYYREIVAHDNKYIFPTPEEFEWNEAPNKINSNGQKIGNWILYREESDKIRAKIHYHLNGQGISETTWAVLYDESGEISEVICSTGLWDFDGPQMRSMDRDEYLRLFEEKVNAE